MRTDIQGLMQVQQMQSLARVMTSHPSFDTSKQRGRCNLTPFSTKYYIACVASYI